ncbi:hypothetical protein E2C01_078425 [Portunus trituberculatus]|uniref:Uncharacterized protein n=1 Tax=Portunus trituberculatus TaxID=210409 RepID=A0A5B7IGY1_PORTR|nr:hypothetical protein [Portunus trituberculatus]
MTLSHNTKDSLCHPGGDTWGLTLAAAWLSEGSCVMRYLPGMENCARVSGNVKCLVNTCSVSSKPRSGEDASVVGFHMVEHMTFVST